jgi:DNA-binding PadR family transcriptional regulator
MVSALEAQTGAHPPRRMFQLTPLGRSAYQDWITSPVNAPRLMRQEFMAKLYFTQQENKDAVRKLIEKQHSVCQNWVAEFNRQFSASEPGSFRRVMFQYRVGQIEAMIGWLETLG